MTSNPNNSIEINADLQSFFFDECSAVASKQGLKVSDQLTGYIASMLHRFVSSPSFFEVVTDPHNNKTKNAIPPVGQKLLEAQNKGTFEQLVEMQKVGDIALFTSGFFSENLDRRMLDLDFYSAIGGQAYQRAGQIRETISKERILNVYFELSGNFEALSEVLSELSDRQYLHSKSKQLSLYEKWLSTGNPRIKRMLAEVGIMSGSPNSNPDSKKVG